MILANIISLILFIISIVFLFLIVPKQYILKKLVFGLIFGIGTAFLIFYYLESRFGFWEFSQEDIIYIGDIGVFLAAVWTPLVVIFVYLIKLAENLFTKLILTIFFPLLSVLSHYGFEINEMLVYDNWSYFDTFLLSFIVHLSIIGALYIIGDLETN